MSSEAFLLEKLAHPGGFPPGSVSGGAHTQDCLPGFSASGRRGSKVHAFSGMDQDIALNQIGSFWNF